MVMKSCLMWGIIALLLGYIVGVKYPSITGSYGAKALSYIP